MPNWYYDLTELKSTPSVVGGMEYSTEQRYRKEGARFIFNVGTKMGLRNDTLATGVVYFHRFYMFHSFATFPRFVTACCCLFLAGKVEETPKKCKDIIKTARTHLTARQFTQFGDDPKEEVMTLERILLQTIKFDLQVDHPYKYLLRYAKSLKGDKEKLQEMVQMAWTFINDSLCTTLCLQWEPEIIGIALMYLAGKLTKFEIIDWDGRTPKHKYWWDMFVENLNTDFLEGICHQFLDFYGFQSPITPQDSPTNNSAKRPKKGALCLQINSIESPTSEKSRTHNKGTPVANSVSVSSSSPPSLPSCETPGNTKPPIATLSKQNSLVASDATKITPTTKTTLPPSEQIISTPVSLTNVNSSLIQNVSNIDVLHHPNYPQGMGQTLDIDKIKPAVYEGQQTSTVPVPQGVSNVLVPPPPLFNNHNINVYPQQATVSEKLRSQPSNPYFANSSSPFNGHFPHLTYQQPPSQCYQRQEHREHYYGSISHAPPNHQNTYIPPPQCPMVSSLPVGQTLPPLQHPLPLRSLPHLISFPPPPLRRPLQDQFVNQPSQVRVQYHANGHSPTMPFPLHQKQVLASSLSFATPSEGMNPVPPTESAYRYGIDTQTQSAQHHLQNSIIPPTQKF